MFAESVNLGLEKFGFLNLSVCKNPVLNHISNICNEGWIVLLCLVQQTLKKSRLLSHFVAALLSFLMASNIPQTTTSSASRDI